MATDTSPQDPSPPYSVTLPERFQDTPYLDLPAAMKKRVDEHPNIVAPVPPERPIVDEGNN